MPALVLSGLLLLGAAVLSQSVSTPEERSPVPREMYATPIIIVQEDTLLPVMHRIAQCKSGGQHFTRDGKVVRSTQHAANLGLFHINKAVWGKKAQDLWYDLHTPEGNARMARYPFDNYGSVAEFRGVLEPPELKSRPGLQDGRETTARRSSRRCSP